VFRAADEDGSGSLDPSEFRACLGRTKLPFLPDEVETMLVECDQDGDGRVSYEEFVPKAFELLIEIEARRLKAEADAMKARRREAEAALLRGMTREQLEEQLRKVFEAADEDGSGSLSGEEFKACLQSIGELGLTKADADHLLKRADADGDGGVSCAEFLPTAYDLLVELTAKRLAAAAAAKERAQMTEAEAAEELLGMGPQQVESLLMEIFRAADADGSGTLDGHEFERCLQLADERAQFGPKDEHGHRHHTGLEKHDIRRMRQEMDENHDGCIDFAEFVPCAFDMIVKVIAAKKAAHEKELKEAEAWLQAESDDSSDSDGSVPDAPDAGDVLGALAAAATGVDE
jgi:Ca2+-binding EF-hand superfamily protein